MTHTDSRGNIRMVDVSSKSRSFRTARAQGEISMRSSTMEAILKDDLPKGPVLTTAKIAGIQAAKRTAELIPLCHQLNLTWVDIEFITGSDRLIIHSTVKTSEATGVEMEALTAVSVAALTVYDMCKSVDGSLRISGIVLTEKKGGKSDFVSEYRPKVGIITLSDGVFSGEREDASGPILKAGFEEEGCSILHTMVLPDGADGLEPTIQKWSQEGVELILTTGGTGLGPRDLTVPIIERLLDRHLPGIEQALHAYGRHKTKTAMLSRLVAGTMGETVIICLPGSPGAVKDALNVLIPAVFHAFHMLKGEGH